MTSKGKTNKGPNPSKIVSNKRARFDYFIEDSFEAGVALEGWEVKSLRAGKAQLVDSYVIVKQNEAWLLGSLITPLPTASTHIRPDSRRTRKLLMHRKEIDRLIGAIERKGYTLVALSMYWKHGKVKVEIGMAKGKQTHDKRATTKDREWQREKGRILKRGG